MYCQRILAQTQIKGSSFISDIYRLDRRLFLMKRNQNYSNFNFVDTYAGNWCVLILPWTSAALLIRSGTEQIRINPGSMIFLPPYSIVSWTILESHNLWYCYMGKFPLLFPKNTKRFVCALDKQYSPNWKFPNTEEEFQEWLLIKSQFARELKSDLLPSAIACKLKSVIEDNYRDECLINKISAQLKISRMVLSRAFKKAYGMSPVQYRNKLRVFASLDLYNKLEQVSDIAASSGFLYQGQYIRSFRNYLGLNPKKYSPRWQNPKLRDLQSI